MERTVGNGRIELVKGNIVEEKVDAIVNAANETLLGGGGVDGAIHRAAGPKLLEECRALPPDADGKRCPTGEVRVTSGADLPARFVVHAVGPVYDDRRADQSAELLREVHENALAEAAERGVKSIAFPAISTGAYRFPVSEAAPIAIGAANRFLSEHTSGTIEVVRFVLFNDSGLQAFERALDRTSVWPEAT
jgi:O-acetyl-ADP-ribose deacetylase (regulator of RNase III)